MPVTMSLYLLAKKKPPERALQQSCQNQSTV